MFVEAQEHQSSYNIMNESESLVVPANADRVIKSIDEHSAIIDKRISSMGSAGDALDTSASELAQDAASLTAGDTGITVTDLGPELKIGLVGDILFDFKVEDNLSIAVLANSKIDTKSVAAKIRARVV